MANLDRISKEIRVAIKISCVKSFCIQTKGGKVELKQDM